MACSAFIVFTFTAMCVRVADAKNAFISIQCKPENVGQHGQESLLECVVQTTQEVTDPEIQVVTWTKKGVENTPPLLVFNAGSTKLQPGYRWAKPSWNSKTMNVSLLIDNTVVANAGTYTCLVMTTHGSNTMDTDLRVTAKYREPIVHTVPEKMTVKADGDLVCETHGGYPRGQIKWLVGESEEMIESSKMEHPQAQSGLFNLTGKLTLKRGLINSKYTCVVLSASGDTEAKAIFSFGGISAPIGANEEKGLDKATAIAAPLVVIGTIIISLLLVLIFFRRGRRYRQTVGQDEFVEEGTLPDMDECNTSSPN